MISCWLLAQEAAAEPSRWKMIRHCWETIIHGCALTCHWLSLPTGRLVVATVLGGLGLWWMLPGPRGWLKLVGALVTLLSGCLMLSVVPRLGLQVESVLFWMMTGVTLSSAAATITSRSPLYCAIWFALVLLGTGGLFLIHGAPFVGMATIAVYAGAIVVTFLFVLMFAQPEGHSFYDRISWGQLPALAGCLAGAALAATLLGALSQTPFDELGRDVTQRQLAAEQHVAALGGQLFTRHLIAVQVGGTLLLAALVGAVAMAAQGTEHRSVETTAVAHPPSTDSALSSRGTRT